MRDDRVPVVLVPGFMLDETMWDNLSSHLPSSWILYRASLKGGNTVEDIVRKIVEDVPEHFILVGFSLGGYIAREIAGKFPERVAALILIASSIREDTEETIEQKRNAVRTLSPHTFSGLGSRSIAKSLHPGRSADNALIGRIRDMSVRLGYRAFAAQSGLRRAGIPTTEIRCPTLVVAGAQDALRSIDEAVELRDSIPNAILEIVDNTGHMIPIEQPALLGLIISKWLEGLTPKLESLSR